jgi:D-glycero-D-manno-heptose 1,7-bisphosphate phosphatase
MSDEQVAELAAQVPGTRVHASLDAFAEWLIARERSTSRTASGRGEA